MCPIQRQRVLKTAITNGTQTAEADSENLSETRDQEGVMLLFYLAGLRVENVRAISLPSTRLGRM